MRPLPATRFTEVEIEKALTVLAYYSGNASRAAKELEQNHQLKISPATLTTWKRDTHYDRYQHVHDQLMPRIRERQAQVAEELVDRAAEAEEQTLDRYLGQINTLNGKDAAIAVKNLATARGISTDKARLYRNEPTSIVQTHNADQLIRKLAAAGVIDGTAEELPPRSLQPPDNQQKASSRQL